MPVLVRCREGRCRHRSAARSARRRLHHAHPLLPARRRRAAQAPGRRGDRPPNARDASPAPRAEGSPMAPSCGSTRCPTTRSALSRRTGSGASPSTGERPQNRTANSPPPSAPLDHVGVPGRCRRAAARRARPRMRRAPGPGPTGCGSPPDAIRSRLTSEADATASGTVARPADSTTLPSDRYTARLLVTALPRTRHCPRSTPRADTPHTAPTISTRRASPKCSPFPTPPRWRATCACAAT